MTSELGRSLRIGRGKNSQQKTAKDIEVDVQTLRKLESGMFVRLDEETITKLAEVAGMERDVFKLMYEHEYRQELRTTQISEATPVEKASPLSSLETALRSLPDKDQEELINMFMLMVQAKALGEGCFLTAQC